jgi:hypothetical protein
MKRHPATSRSKAAIAIVCGLAAAGGAAMALRAQSLNDLTPQLPVSDPMCPYFGNPAQGTASQTASLSQLNPASRGSIGARSLTKLTAQIAAQLPPVPGGGRTSTAADLTNASLIDGYIFSALQSAGVQPADPTTDWEFIRRVTLDLTGRIPNPSDVLAFVADPTPTKRAALVDKLIASPQWIDKWTMYFGDLLKNNSSNSQIDRYRPGAEAFYTYIKSSLAANKPYDQMTRELIVSQATNSYNTGEVNFNVGGVVTGGPVQDIWDQQLANIADTFLGIAHQNCLLCHNGAGHLTTLSLWGGQQTRVAAWGMAAFIAQTYTYSTAVSKAIIRSTQPQATARHDSRSARSVLFLLPTYSRAKRRSRAKTTERHWPA